LESEVLKLNEVLKSTKKAKSEFENSNQQLNKEIKDSKDSVRRLENEKADLKLENQRLH
jgi:septal ring factor EnvC (AmiA/AmiB activator)